MPITLLTQNLRGLRIHISCLTFGVNQTPRRKYINGFEESSKKKGGRWFSYNLVIPLHDGEWINDCRSRVNTMLFLRPQITGSVHSDKSYWKHSPYTHSSHFGHFRHIMSIVRVVLFSRFLLISHRSVHLTLNFSRHLPISLNSAVIFKDLSAGKGKETVHRAALAWVVVLRAATSATVSCRICGSESSNCRTPCNTFIQRCRILAVSVVVVPRPIPTHAPKVFWLTNIRKFLCV